MDPAAEAVDDDGSSEIESGVFSTRLNRVVTATQPFQRQRAERHPGRGFQGW